MKIKSFKGAKSYLFKDGDLLQFVFKKLSKIAKKRFYFPSYTSLINNKKIFQETLGEETEIIEKELFLLKNTDFCLRPEGTANLLNTLINENFLKSEKFPLKLFYINEMFRYERPQKGRYRQFFQFGVELINDKYEILDDIEILEMAIDILKEFNLENEVVLNINFIGNHQERESYNQYIKDFFQQNFLLREKLQESSKKILERNPIRLLDTKNLEELEIVEKLDLLENFLSEETLTKFESLKTYLNKNNMNYKVNKNLVRGLDYYNDLCFEFQIKDNENRMNTIIGGGRYDSLIHKLDKKNKILPGVGFALGIDRMIDHFKDKILEQKNKENCNLFKIGLFFAEYEADNVDILVKLNLIEKYLLKNYDVLKIKSNFKKFGKISKSFEERGVSKIIILGQEEIESNTITIRDLNQKTQQKFEIDYKNIYIELN